MPNFLFFSFRDCGRLKPAHSPPWRAGMQLTCQKPRGEEGWWLSYFFEESGGLYKKLAGRGGPAERQRLGGRQNSSLPHKCGVPPGNGTPHLCGSGGPGRDLRVPAPLLRVRFLWGGRSQLKSWAERSACGIWVSLGSSGALLGKTLGGGPPPSRSRLGGRAGRVQKRDRPVCFLDGARLPVERGVNFSPKFVPFLFWQGSC